MDNTTIVTTVRVEYKPDKIFFSLFDCTPDFNAAGSTLNYSIEKPNNCFEALISTALVLAVSTAVLLIFSLIQCYFTIKMKNKFVEINQHVNELLRNAHNPAQYGVKPNTIRKVASTSETSESESSNSESDDSSESEKPTNRKNSRMQKSNQIELKKINNSEGSLRLPRYKVYKANEKIQEIVIQNEHQNVKTHKSRKVRDTDENSIDNYEIKNKKKAHHRSASKNSRTSRGSHNGKKVKEVRY